MTDPMTLFAALAMATAPVAEPAPVDHCRRELTQAGPRAQLVRSKGSCTSPSRTSCGRFESH